MKGSYYLNQAFSENVGILYFDNVHVRMDMYQHQRKKKKNLHRGCFCKS